MPQGQAPKKSKAPLIIGGVIGCLLLIFIIVLAVGGLAYFGFKKAEEAAKSLNANRNVNGSAPAPVPLPAPAPPPPGTPVAT